MYGDTLNNTGSICAT